MSVRLRNFALVVFVVFAVGFQAQAEIVRVEIFGSIQLGDNPQGFIDNGWVEGAGFTGYVDFDLLAPLHEEAVGFMLQTGEYELVIESAGTTDFYPGRFEFYFPISGVIRGLTAFFSSIGNIFDTNEIDQIFLLDDLSLFSYTSIEFNTFDGSAFAGITSTNIFVIPAPASLVPIGLIGLGCARRRRA